MTKSFEATKIRQKRSFARGASSGLSIRRSYRQGSMPGSSSDYGSPALGLPEYQKELDELAQLTLRLEWLKDSCVAIGMQFSISSK